MTAETKPAPNRHRAAVTRMLRATGLANIPEEAPLVELLKDLARELDEGGGARARADYLSAQKDVRRVLNMIGSGKVGGSSESGAKAKKPEEPDVEEPVAPVQNDLAKFKAQRGIA